MEGRKADRTLVGSRRVRPRHGLIGPVGITVAPYVCCVAERLRRLAPTSSTAEVRLPKSRPGVSPSRLQEPNLTDDEIPRQFARVSEATASILGSPGRLLSLSKTAYAQRHPRHLVVFNGNVVVSSRDGAFKVWHGDIDLTDADQERLLHEVARRTGRIVYLLYEYDGRFGNERKPRIERAVFSVTPSHHTTFDFQSVERGADGALRLR